MAAQRLNSQIAMTLLSPYPFWTGRRALSVLYVYSGAAIALLLMANVALLSHLRERALSDTSAVLRDAGAELAEQADRSLQSLELALAKVAERMVGRVGSAAPERA